MGAIKRYFKNQFQWHMLKIEHHDVSDFYIGCFQNSTSCLPLLFIRGVLFFGAVSIVVASIVLTAQGAEGHLWPIYLTHWGIFMNMISVGFGFAVSLFACLKGPIDDDFELPWFIKAYWISYNIAIPSAIFITVFYWVFLSGFVSDEEGELQFAIDKALDVFIHAINSVVMVLLLLTARQPVYMLHFYFVVFLAPIYLIFSLIYHYAGGTDMLGNQFIYPMLDWSNPGGAVITGVASVVLVVIIHGLVSILAVGRDAFSKWVMGAQSVNISNEWIG